MQGYSSNLGVKQIKYISVWRNAVMKRLVNQNIKSSRNFTDSQVMFTLENVVNLLSQIKELSNRKILVIDDTDGLKLIVGEYEYRILSW